MNFPGLKLYSGDAWQWSESLADYSPDDFDMKVVIKMGANAAVIFNAQSAIVNAVKVFVFYCEYYKNKYSYRRIFLSSQA